ncbi:MAG: ABC transporter ATP-binding protein [Anaerolineae bacterium]
MEIRLFQRRQPAGNPLDSAVRDGGRNGALIQMREVVKTYRTPAGDFHALRGVDVDLYAGEFVGVVGRSGSGKSTLVNMITGIDRPTSGKVDIGGVHVHHLSESKMARWRGRNLGIVFQFYQLLPMLSLLENVLLPMDFGGVYPLAEREDRAWELLGLVGLAEQGHKLPSALSGGQQQCAAIARALANDPPIIVADEPTGNLDSHAAAEVFRVFEGLAQEGKMVVMVTHDDSLVQQVKRVVRLDDGQIVTETTP